jgi:beta-lactamase class A
MKREGAALIPRELQEDVDRIVPEVPGGECSVYARNLKTGEVAALNEREWFPGASVIKTCVLIDLFRHVHAGKYSLDDLVTVGADTGGAHGSGILKHLGLPLKLSVYNLATLMIIISDNTAANKCIELTGFESVTDTCRSYGCTDTVLRRYFIGAAYDDIMKDNIVTTGDLGLLFERLYRKELVSPLASEQMLGILKRQTVNGRIPLHLPQSTVIAHKTGTQPVTAHDAGIVYGPAGNDYVISIAVTGIPARPTGEKIIADISKAVWDYFTGQ